MAEAKNKTIMIVEDDTFVLDIYHTKLSNEGFEIITAADGVEAMEKLEKEKIVPNLILLDIIMPNMDGLEVLRRVQKIEALKNTPIVMLTNLSQRDEIEEALNLGAKDYLIKSHFTPVEVLEKINKYLV
jgi:CheY-like chemotaxis protein